LEQHHPAKTSFSQLLAGLAILELAAILPRAGRFLDSLHGSNMERLQQRIMDYGHGIASESLEFAVEGLQGAEDDVAQLRWGNQAGGHRREERIRVDEFFIFADDVLGFLAPDVALMAIGLLGRL